MLMDMTGRSHQLYYQAHSSTREGEGGRFRTVLSSAIGVLSNIYMSLFNLIVQRRKYNMYIAFHNCKLSADLE